MITGGGKRIFRLGARQAGHGAELERDTRVEETSGGNVTHLSVAAPNGPEPLSQTIAAAVEHERRRMAADVHDLVMQDLARVLARARMLADDTPAAASIVAAAERALAGARGLVCGLTVQRSEPIAAAVTAGVRKAARDIPVTVVAQDVPPLPEPDRQTFSAIVHIAREAVTNAVKHGSPTRIDVALECPEEWRLRIRDDGRGFDADRASGGFGLQSMRRQAHALGGRLKVTSDAGAGTTVVALLP